MSHCTVEPYSRNLFLTTSPSDKDPIRGETSEEVHLRKKIAQSTSKVFNNSERPIEERRKMFNAQLQLIKDPGPLANLLGTSELNLLDSINLSVIFHSIAVLMRDLKSSEIKRFLRDNSVQIQTGISQLKITQFDQPRQLSSIVWAFGMLKIKDDEIWNHLAQQALQLIPTSIIQDLSMMAKGFGEVEYPGKCRETETHPLHTALAAKATSFLQSPGMKLKALGMILRGYSKMGGRDRNFFMTIGAKCLELMEENSSENSIVNWSQICIAFANSRIYNRELLDRIASLTMSQLGALTDVKEVANIVWGFGALGYTNPNFFAAVDQALTHRLRSWKDIDLSQLALGFAKVGSEKLSFFGALRKELLEYRDFDTISMVTLVNLLWATAETNQCSPQLQHKFGETFRRNLPTMELSYVSMVVRSMGKAGSTSKEFYFNAANRVKNFTNVEFTGLEVGNLLSGFSKAGYVDKELLDLLEEKTFQGIGSWNHAVVTSIVNGFSELNRPNTVQEICRRGVISNIEVDAPIKILSRLTASIGFSEVSDLDTFDRLGDRILTKVGMANPYDLAMIAWGCGAGNYQNIPLLHAVSTRAQEVFEKFELQDLSMLAYGLALIDGSPLPLMKRLFFKSIDKMRTDNPIGLGDLAAASALSNTYDDNFSHHLLSTAAFVNNPSDLFLFRFHQYRQYLKATKNYNELHWEPNLIQSINMMLERRIQEKVNPSKFQADVGSVLREVLPSKNPQLLEEEFFICGYPVDIALPKIKVAIEPHGPHHYFLGSNRLTPKSRLKILILENLGWKIVVVPSLEWDTLSSVDEKKCYLTALLDSKGVHPQNLN